MKRIVPGKVLAVVLAAALTVAAPAFAQISVNFNTATDLSLFTSIHNNYTVNDTGGINNTGAVLIPLNVSDLYTYNTPIAIGDVGTVYNVSAYFYNLDNDGFGGLGFSTTSSSDNFGWGCSAKGLGMATHAGGGCFSSSEADSDVDYLSDQLHPNSWYQVIFTVTVTAPGTFDLEYQVWSANPDGSTIAMVCDETMPGVANADVGAATELYPYFSSTQDRMLYIDNFVVNNQPLPIQLASLSASASSGSSVTLNWKTASEKNNYGFFVERSAQKGTGFVTVSALIPGHGTTTSAFTYQYTDKSAPAGASYYRLRQVDLDNSVHYSDAVLATTTDAVAPVVPAVFTLSQNYPNPFNPSTEFRFTVAKAGMTTLTVYNALGQEVAQIFNGQTEPGKYYTARLDGSRLASGIYFARLQGGAEVQMRKIALTK
ncbi:MAG TPA: T9SS type A sorting domain-containing protein [Bacteroidota bacterium]|nr:T9SS type A sorting domain-containing protein [Bacteroidota bacterium]